MKVIQPLKLDIDFYDVVVRRERAAWGPYFKAWGFQAQWKRRRGEKNRFVIEAKSLKILPLIMSKVDFKIEKTGWPWLRTQRSSEAEGGSES